MVMETHILPFVKFLSQDYTFIVSNFVTYNIYRFDMSGTFQDWVASEYLAMTAGGVRGLLAIVRDDGVFFPLYDINGNITHYIYGGSASASPPCYQVGDVVAAVP